MSNIKITDLSSFKFVCPACGSAGTAERKEFRAPKHAASLIPTHPPAAHPPEAYGFECPTCGFWVTRKDESVPLQIYEAPSALGEESPASPRRAGLVKVHKPK